MFVLPVPPLRCSLPEIVSALIAGFNGRANQYSTVAEHTPLSHQQYMQWNGDRFRKWAEKIGSNTETVISAILGGYKVEQQGYKACMGL